MCRMLSSYHHLQTVATTILVLGIVSIVAGTEPGNGNKETLSFEKFFESSIDCVALFTSDQSFVEVKVK